LIDTAAQSSVITQQTVEKMNVQTHKPNNNKKIVPNRFNDLNSTDPDTIAELTIGKREDYSLLRIKALVVGTDLKNRNQRGQLKTVNVI
jgi:hypothetical protein